MEKSIKTGFVKRAAHYGLNIKQAEDLFKSMLEAPGAAALGQASVNQIQQQQPAGIADYGGLGRMLGGAGGALGGGLVGLGAGALTNKKEDSTKQKLLRALGIGAAGAIGGGLGGAAGGELAGQTGYVGGSEGSLDAIRNQYSQIIQGLR